MSWEGMEKQMDRGPIASMGVMWKLTIVALLLIGVTTCGIAVVTKPFSIVSGTLDSDNVKSNYEWFKLRHENILALDVQIKNAQAAVEQFKTDAGPRDKWHREDREEHSRLNTILLGLKNERTSEAGEYNARSRMVSRAIFKGTDTPSEISLEGKTK